MKKALFSVFAFVLAGCSFDADAKLPEYPTLRLTRIDPANLIPVASFRLLCAPGLDNTAAESTFTLAGTYPFAPSMVYDVPKGTLADGDWTCFAKVVTAEMPPRIQPTNRASFTLKQPPGPFPAFQLIIE